jgi:small subunit ribosomal protein S21
LIEIKVRNNNVEKAIRQLKKQIKETGILWELSERRFYTKPSAIKRQKNLKAQLRNKKKQQEIDKNY